jgi:hypothetical protein
VLLGAWCHSEDTEAHWWSLRLQVSQLVVTAKTLMSSSPGAWPIVLESSLTPPIEAWGRSSEPRDAIVPSSRSILPIAFVACQR